MLVNVFSDDNGIIDHDAERHDKGEERDHVDRNVDGRHKEQGAAERYGDAKHDPERQTDLKEQAEGNKHQDQTDQSIPDQQILAAFEKLRVIVPGRKVDRFGKLPALRLDKLFDRIGYFRGLLITDPINLDHGCRLAIKEPELIGLLETILNGCNVTEADFCTIDRC